MKFKPPPANIAARLTQRSDDTEEKVRRSCIPARFPAFVTNPFISGQGSRGRLPPELEGAHRHLQECPCAH
jgi:hypothetical protein